MSESLRVPTVELVTTGSELLLGWVVNSHIAWLGRRLGELGLTLSRAVTVPDGPAIRGAVAEALERADIVLITGGLGPTSDDLTRDVVAELLDRPLKEDAVIVEQIRARFARRGLVAPDMVRVQARVPAGADVLENEHGTAPGLHLEHGGRHVFLLPGPPRELQPMYDGQVVPWLRRVFPEARAVDCVVLRTLGVGESAAQELIEPAVRRECPGVEIGYCARSGEVDVRLVAHRDPDAVARAAAICREALADCVYGEGDDTLERVVIRLATERGRSLATAESCTGGLVAHRLTNVPGSSAVFLGGAVTYANEEKVRQLGVPPELIARHGAVSAEVASAMAAGIVARSGASLAVTTTGIAGPGGGSPEKPVGTLWLGMATAAGTQAFPRRLAQERETFKFMASQAALDLLRRSLLGLALE